MNPSRAKWKDRLHTVAFMAALTVVFMSAVSGAHLLTRNTVTLNQSLYLKRAVLKAAGLTVPEEGLAVETLYRRHVRPMNPSDPEGWLEVTNAPEGAVVLVRQTSGPGLWGEIGAMVGFRTPDLVLSGIAFTAQNETPGLGARIMEPWFVGQFRGKRAALALVPEGTQSSKPDEIDAITGASITSRAVRDLVNRAADEARQAVPPPAGTEGA